MTLPNLVVHADWSTDAGKRWCCVARCDGDQYWVDAPKPVGEVSGFISGFAKNAPKAALIGFDFPIGVPRAYAEKVAFADFVTFLLALGHPPFDRFFEVARTPAEISVSRPFYPYRPGGTKQAHLLEALGLTDIDELYRVCERASQSRGQASPLFWTLGPKQVGKAAISGWRDVLCPALNEFRDTLAIWPFEGSLETLLSSGRCVLAETYPADACVQLGISAPGRGWSKTEQVDRQRVCRSIRQAARGSNILFSGALECALEDGFGAESSGEDPFDAFVGAVAMLRVVLGFQPDGLPKDPIATKIEGWILGQQPT